MVSLVEKIEYVIINSNWTQEIMAGQKRSQDIQKKLRDFPNITLAGWESAIVTKTHLKHIYPIVNVHCALLSDGFWSFYHAGTKLARFYQSYKYAERKLCFLWVDLMKFIFQGIFCYAQKYKLHQIDIVTYVAPGTQFSP